LGIDGVEIGVYIDEYGLVVINREDHWGCGTAEHYE
jgi:hypothetical protein